MSFLDDIPIKKFQDYLRIPSVHPNVNYDECISFLRAYANELDLPIVIYTPTNERKPIAVISWIGTEPTYASILLSSNMDVVPVNTENWNHGPFDGTLTKQGLIYGRGAQDAKCNGIQYLEAIRKLKNAGEHFYRTIHVMFTPDEEIGGEEGIKPFVQTEDFKKLNAGFAFVKGCPGYDDTYLFANGERITWHLEYHCKGAQAHGSTLDEDTAAKKVAYIMRQIYNYREYQLQRLKDDGNLKLGDISSFNVTMLSGGSQANIMPTKLVLAVDIRLSASEDLPDMDEILELWGEEAGKNVTLKYIHKGDRTPFTLRNQCNQYHEAFKRAMGKLRLKFRNCLYPGSTDGRFFREAGVGTFGFSPMINTPALAHADNEFISLKIFLEGINVYCEIIKEVANHPQWLEYRV